MSQRPADVGRALIHGDAERPPGADSPVFPLVLNEGECCTAIVGPACGEVETLFKGGPKMGRKAN